MVFGKAAMWHYGNGAACIPRRVQTSSGGVECIAVAAEQPVHLGQAIAPCLPHSFDEDAADGGAVPVEEFGRAAPRNPLHT